MHRNGQQIIADATAPGVRAPVLDWRPRRGGDPTQVDSTLGSCGGATIQEFLLNVLPCERRRRCAGWWRSYLVAIRNAVLYC